MRFGAAESLEKGLDDRGATRWSCEQCVRPFSVFGSNLGAAVMRVGHGETFSREFIV